jgi:hypothetical protein
MTPEQLQAHAAALGYPWVAMNEDRHWLMYDARPRWFDRGGAWRPMGSGCEWAVVLVDVTYAGTARASLRGPKENK